MPEAGPAPTSLPADVPYPHLEDALALYREGEKLRADASRLIDDGVPPGSSVAELTELVNTTLLEATAVFAQAQAAMLFPVATMLTMPVRTLVGAVEQARTDVLTERRQTEHARRLSFEPR